MSQQPPNPLQYATPSGPMIDLKKVAKQQRTLIYCILTEILLMVARIAVSGSIPMLGLLFALIYLGVAVTAAVFIFMLAISLYNVGLGVVLGILALIPLLGLLILLMVNGKATKLLRSHGVRVGLLGADPKTIPLE
jgi:hypothetical protein